MAESLVGTVVAALTAGAVAASRELYDSVETLTASPFTNAAGDDFSPVDEGAVKEGSLPQTWHSAS